MEDWVQYKCSDLLEFYSTNSLSWEQLDYESEELLNLHYGLIHVGLPTLINVAKHNLPAIKSEFVPKNYTLCKNGDVAFADASEDTNEVAKPIEFFECSDKQVVCGLHTIHGRDKLDITEVGFKGYAFSSTPFHHKIRRLAQGSKVFSISAKNFSEVSIGVPSKKEQQKIIGLLSKLDERINTQNKIIEDLKKLKSAISNRLFGSRDLLDTQVSIFAIGTLKNGYAFQSNTYDATGAYKIITIANVSGERYINADNCNCVQTISNDIQAHQILKANDILISLTGNVGRVSLCTEGNYLLNQRVGLLQLKQGVNREYIYQALSHKKFEQSMVACGQGAAQMNIGKNDVEDYIIPYSYNPHNIETIASTLKAYDSLICVELDNLKLFQRQKCYLLAQMFI